MIATLALLLLAAVCLPPGMPPLDQLRAESARVYQLDGMTGDPEHYLTTGVLYVAPDGRRWSVLRVIGLLGLVDDHPDTETTDWWLDPGVFTDEVPPTVRRNPTATCQWRRRAET